MWNWHKEEVLKAGLFWPEKLTIAEMMNAGTGWHLFPNAIVMPSVDGFLCYRMRPYNDNPDMAIFDIWCLRRYRDGEAPKVESHVSDGFETARERNAFLAQDFDNMSAVNAGMKSRGFPGARTNPQEEGAAVNFRKVIDQYLRGAR